MEEDNIKSWVGQPDVCRCCLSTSGKWDLTASYKSDLGLEVFADMISDCYGISLSHLSEWGPSRLVCGVCVEHLRDACSFKKQVLRAEEHFSKYFTSRVDSVKIKSEDEHNYQDNPEVEDFENSKKDIKTTHTLIKIEVECNKRKRNKTTARKRKSDTDKLDDDNDSDVPIAELSKKSELYAEGDKVNKQNIEKPVKDDVTNEECKGVLLCNEPIQKTKQISERKRVILTCNIVLNDTTACPFRHHKSWFQCFFCSQDFMEINSLRNHTLQHHQDIQSELKNMKRYPRSLQIDISALQCRSCQINLTDVKSMQRHFEIVHDKVIYNECIADYKVNSSPYSCHLCNQEFHVFRTLTTHLNEHYANCICDVCGRSFINSKRLKVHKRIHENGQFPCAECGKVLKTKTSKANHMESAHSKRQIKCQICFKPMKHYNDRIKHMSEVHNITHKFKCPICSREYNIKHYLATHIRQTHGNKNKKCTECGMAFITNHGLKKHMLKHTGERPFSCHICSKAYARSYTLREHLRAHENDRRFLGPE